MSLKHRVRLYACLAKDEPLAIAVYDTPEKKFDARGGGIFPDGGVIFPIAVGVRLTEKIRVNRASGIVKPTPRRDLGGEPFPVLGGIALDDPKSELWVKWTPGEIERQSLHFMLSECAARDLCGFKIDLSQDWSKEGMRANFREVEPRPTKRTQLKWLAAWQLPFWEKDGIPASEQYSQLQFFASADGLEQFSMSHFQNIVAEIKRT